MLLGGSRIGVTVRFPELSNFECLPSRVGGFPFLFRFCMSAPGKPDQVDQAVINSLAGVYSAGIANNTINARMVATVAKFVQCSQ